MNPCSQYSLTTTDISQHNQLGLAWLGLAWLAVKERLFFSFIYWDEKSRRYHREWYA